MKLDARFEFKLQDMWLGWYWRTTYCSTDDGPQKFATSIWICLVPCFPLHITIWHTVTIRH